MSSRKRFHPGGFPRFSTSALTRTAGEHLSAALSKATAYAETLSGGTDRDALVVNESGEFGVKIADPIN